MARLKKSGRLRFNFGALVLPILTIVTVVLFIWVQNGYTYINNIKYESNSIPRQFTGYKIAHISNIDNESVDAVSKLKDQDVDIIVVSGGLVDANGNFNKSIEVLNNLNDIVPTYFVLQTKDMEYKDQIVSATNATYLNGNGITIQSEDISTMDYIKYTSDKGVIKEIEKDTDKSKEYVEYIEGVLKEDKDKTIELLGIDCHSENIYDDIDMIYESTDNTSVLTISALGDISKYKKLCEIDTVNIYLSGGTYGLKDYIPEFDGTLQDISEGVAKIFNTAGVCKEIPDTRRFFNLREIQIIELSDGLVYKRNPLEQLFGLFVTDVGTIFDNDNGFKEYEYKYD